MVSDSTRPSHSPFQAQAEIELLQLILNETEAPYPWNPADMAAHSYFEALEQEIAASWTIDEFAPYVQALASHVDQAWATLQPAQSDRAHVVSRLFERFAAQVPQSLLNSIAQQAQLVMASNLSLADQLVACVRDLLPEWGDEDLQVLARPFAYAMRSGADSDLIEGVLRSVRSAEWSELSAIEQARLSLAIARYAIAQLPSAESVDA